MDRDQRINEICSGFVSPSAANKNIYRVILELLWPEGTSLPGPVIPRKAIIAAIDADRAKKGKGPYRDAFRRVRELQGEEGLLDIVKVGSNYQMNSDNVSPKRVPRAAVSDTDWRAIRDSSLGACAVCGAREADGASLSPDHRVPRVRGGGDGIGNFQALCQNCNIFKSVSCRGCAEECTECPWCDPAANPVVTVRGTQLKVLAAQAVARGTTAQSVLEQVLNDAFQEGFGK